MSAILTFEDSVKARLKSIVAELIPEDRWNSIVQETVRDFERNDLPKLVKAELAEKYKAAIAEEFAKPEWKSNWGQAGLESSTAVKALLIEAAPMVLASMIGGAMQNVTQQLQYALQQNRPY